MWYKKNYEKHLTNNILFYHLIFFLNWTCYKTNKNKNTHNFKNGKIYVPLLFLLSFYCFVLIIYYCLESRLHIARSRDVYISLDPNFWLILGTMEMPRGFGDFPIEEMKRRYVVTLWWFSLHCFVEINYLSENLILYDWKPKGLFCDLSGSTLICKLTK